MLTVKIGTCNPNIAVLSRSCKDDGSKPLVLFVYRGAALRGIRLE